MKLQHIIKKHGFTPSEDAEQLVVVQWLKLQGVLFHHSPNGGNRHIITATRLKAQGCSKGFPDLIILDPPPCGGYVGAAVEMKKVKGGTLSPEQRAWLMELELRKWKAKCCKGAGDAIEWLQSLGYGRRKII